MYQATLNHCTEMDFYGSVVDIPCDSRLGLKFKKFRDLYRSDYRAVDNQMGYTHIPFDTGLLADNKGTRLIAGSADAAANLAIDTQTAGESDIAIYSGSGSDQAINSALGFVWFLAEHTASV